MDQSVSNRMVVTVARLNRSQVSLYVTAQDEDGEETGEDVTRDDSWDYTAILWNGIQAEAVRATFEKLTYREQRLLEERNAICMTCGRVSPISERKSFEELAVMFEGSTASGDMIWSGLKRINRLSICCSVCLGKHRHFQNANSSFWGGCSISQALIYFGAAANCLNERTNHLIGIQAG